jgi:adenine-specific DNA-methyltransferase
MKTNEEKTNGIVYTPQWIVDNFRYLNYKNNIHDKKIIDPACGEGAF